MPFGISFCSLNTWRHKVLLLKHTHTHVCIYIYCPQNLKKNTKTRVFRVFSQHLPDFSEFFQVFFQIPRHPLAPHGFRRRFRRRQAKPRLRNLLKRRQEKRGERLDAARKVTQAPKRHGMGWSSASWRSWGNIDIHIIYLSVCLSICLSVSFFFHGSNLVTCSNHS